MITSKALRVLGFIKRFSKDFKDHNVMKQLYSSLVRPNLEYCSIVFSPYTRDGIERIESVQRNFTKFACRKMIPNRGLCYDDRCSYLSLDKLEKRRINAGHFFISKILNGKIDSAQLLGNLKLNVPCPENRSTSLLKENTKHKTDYGQNNPISRMVRDFKDVQNHFDFHLQKTRSRTNFET